MAWSIGVPTPKVNYSNASNLNSSIKKKILNYFFVGVETTRRFLLEWLSFLHRYAPHGIVLNPPQTINQRLPFYKGRDDLETMLSSPSAGDWVKITEMFLGKVPDGFSFEPKHKAHAYK